MSIQSKQKGSRAELAVRDLLRKMTGLQWEKTPLSGALDEVHGLSGDIYIPQERNKYTIEVKHYAEPSINHLLLTGKTPQIKEWWEQTIREAKENKNLPLLVFKHDRSKFFVATNAFDDLEYPKILVRRKDLNIQISLLEEWIQNTKPEFIHVR